MGISLKIKPPRITKTEADFLSIAECRALLNACTNLRDYTIVMILLTTGLRNSECTRIRTSQDVDLKNLQITIRDRGEGMKNYQEKKVLLTKQCAETLKRWVEYRATLKIDNDYLFITTSGEPFAGRERLNKLIKGIAQRAGINRPVTCHMLRHSAAVAMLRAGMPLTSVSRQLGHTSVSTTTEYYLHATYDDLREDIKKYSIF
jgi:integrase/recombinase XerD